MISLSGKTFASFSARSSASQIDKAATPELVLWSDIGGFLSGLLRAQLVCAAVNTVFQRSGLFGLIDISRDRFFFDR
jgi:hypothetical protein